MIANMLSFIAMAPPPGDSGAQQPSMTYFIGWMAIMVAIFYVVAIRPQRRREQERQQLLSNVKSGDRVSFSGGIMGTVTNVKDKTLVIKIADKVKIEVARGAVTNILDKGEKPEGEEL